MKKIFLILSSNSYSGAEKVNIDIINGLNKYYDFYYVSPRGPINEYLQKNNIKWIEVSQTTNKEIKRIIKEYKPDLLHASDYKASLACALVNSKIPVIAHLHSNPPWEKSINPFSLAYLYTAKKVDKILVVSDAIEQEYIFKKSISSKVVNIHNPISRKTILDKVPKDYSEKKEFDICCIARLTKPKNPFLFIDIVEKLKEEFKNIRCVWVGTGELEEKARAYSKKKNLDENIEFVGFKNNPYLYIKKSKVFLLTSDWEGFGLVAFEALTLGVPCVVSNVGGLKNIVDDSSGKLCENKGMFVEEITKLLKDQTYYNNKKENAILKSKKIENYEKYCDELNEIYKELMK